MPQEPITGLMWTLQTSDEFLAKMLLIIANLWVLFIKAFIQTGVGLFLRGGTHTKHRNQTGITFHCVCLKDTVRFFNVTKILLQMLMLMIF